MALSEHVAVNRERLRTSLLSLAKFGGDDSGRRVDRPSFSNADVEARDWLAQEMTSSGLAVHTDAVGNVFGRWEVGSGPAILVGSHLDSVPAGGIFDGALGVMAALECVRTLQESQSRVGCPIEVVGTSEEEGRFGGMLGAQALVGDVSPDWLSGAADDSGTRLTDAMRAAGFDPTRIREARRDPFTVRAFLELHIEQGPVLERLGKAVGVVSGISGVFNWTIVLTGTANHAGTTPMDMRRDAFRGLVDFAHEIPTIIAQHGGPQTRVTIGKVALQPGFPHTVPGRAEFSLIGRDLDEEVMKAIAGACRQSLKDAAAGHGLGLEVEEMSWLAPSRCHSEIVTAFREVAESLGVDYELMPSGAGHDTQFLARLTRAGMIFIPSVGGVSHSEEEWTDWDDIETGTNVLLHTMLRLSQA